MKKKIETKKAPKALGTYSQAISIANTVYLSGQIPINPKTSNISRTSRDISEQTTCNILSINWFG